MKRESSSFGNISMTYAAYIKLSTLTLLVAIAGQVEFVNADEVSGLIIPRDNDGMYVRNDEGQFEVTWTPKTKVALVANTRLLSGLTANRLEYKIHSSKEVVTFSIPKGPITGIKSSRLGSQLENALKEAKDEKWISEHGLTLYFNQEPAREQLPSKDDPRFIGLWDPTTKPRTLSINGTKYEISLKKGGQTKALLYNVLTVKDCKPFINRVTVIGQTKGDILFADEIHIQLIGDQAANDDPKLPRYLFIGDSISGNYDKGLRAALAGKFNLHHPPTNCGPSVQGARSIADWLGAYDQPGRHWDVISFNHGHWDSKNNKADYQANLGVVIRELKKTGAKLIWVTTCPVPNGNPAASPLDDQGKAPGRTAGVMAKYLNPWAAEVMARHPEITACDQWQFVKDNEGGLYTDWWAGKNVHFGGEPADALGRLLADAVTTVMKGEKTGTGGGETAKLTQPLTNSGMTSSRTFTDTVGRQIEAEVVEVTGDKVTLRMKGKDYTIPFTSLSLADQNYLKEWPRHNASNQATPSGSKPKTVKIAGGPVGATREKVPLWNPDYQHSGKKAYGLYSEEEAARALHPAWRDVQWLSEGFSEEADASFRLETRISDGAGGYMDLSKKPAADLLAKLKENYSRGDGLEWYFLPKEDRYRNGPGLTGDELLDDLKTGKFVEEGKHTTFIYGFYKKNVDTYYRLYRVSGGDPDYRDQIVKYAEGIEWLIENRPQQLLPAERRAETLSDPVAEIPHEPAAVGNFFANTVAARLLLEGQPNAQQIEQAKRFLATTKKYTASQITSDYLPTYDRRNLPFTEGNRTRMLREKFQLPPRAAQVIEYQPWNQTFFYFATLAHAAKAYESLQRLEEHEDHAETIHLYRNICRAAMYAFQTENICVVREGRPYFFHAHGPRRDKDPRMCLGFPMFDAEDNGHSGSGANHLGYLWEAGEEFGCRTILLAGYANAMAITMDDACMTDKKGNAWPRGHLDNPWYLAASGRKNHPAKRLANKYYHLMAFSPEIVAANRPYAEGDEVWSDGDLRQLWAGYLYRAWMVRRNQTSAK